MFAEALKSVVKYTYPVVISQRLYNREVKCGIASFIILNEEGWILTSAHVLGVFLSVEKHKKEIAEYEKRKAEIESNRKLNHKQRKKMLKKLPMNDKWLTNHSYWWGLDGVKVNGFHYNSFIDLAVGKLVPFDNKAISTYPIFKDPKEELLPGTSLCRLGFPFHNISATFDESKNIFTLEKGAIPLPRFPIDGIHTRVAIAVDKESKKQAKFIETSSPGLRGQSGGPIFDVNGNIWGLQSRTTHLPLGFSPKVKYNKSEVEEHQFINVGLGTHVEEIINFLKENNIRFNISTNK
jgi:hypothetical protein